MSSSMGGSRGMQGSKIPRGYRQGQIQQYTPEQTQLFESLFGQVGPGSQLSKLASGSDEGFAPYEDYANRQFQEFSGQNASRFSGLGMGARKGSGFQNLQTQGAQDFASQLAMQRQGLQRQALADLMGMSGMLLGQRPQENFLVEKHRRQSGFGKALGIGLPLAGAAAGGFFGGPAGAALGGQLGGSLASGFNSF